MLSLGCLIKYILGVVSLEKIKVMVSSTVSELLGERDAIQRAFASNNIVELVGAQPLNDAAISGHSKGVTRAMARECDLYILILGYKFGMDVGNGKSATEIEFDEAYRDDPTKILVFLKENEEPLEPDQKKFINRVCDYYSGYWRPTFKYTHELQDLVLDSFSRWLKERASLGHDLNYLDHFVRLAKQLKPEPTAQVYYQVAKNYVELQYEFFGKTYVLHFDRSDIYSDFWGCLSSMYDQFEVWLSHTTTIEGSH